MLRLILEFELFSGKKNVRVQVSTLEDLTAKFQEVLGLTGQSITVSLWQADLAEWVDVTSLQLYKTSRWTRRKCEFRSIRPFLRPTGLGMDQVWS